MMPYVSKELQNTANFEDKHPLMVRTYRICPYRGRAQIEVGARIEAGGQSSYSLIEAGRVWNRRTRSVIDILIAS